MNFHWNFLYNIYDSINRTTNGFKELMDKEFGYIVTPLAFNINLTLQSSTFQVEKGKINRKFLEDSYKKIRIWYTWSN